MYTLSSKLRKQVNVTSRNVQCHGNHIHMMLVQVLLMNKEGS